MGEIIKVGMADYKIAKSPDSLITLGLGSCVGVVIYDKTKQIAGMAHIMLPASDEIKNNSNKMKFADTCIDMMMEDLLKQGVNKTLLKAKIAGGAQMFKEAEKGTAEINNVRAEQALQVCPEIIVTACPFCNTMLTDGVKNQQKTIVPVMDIALLIEQAEDL